MQVLDEVTNALQVLAPGGTIVLSSALPPSERSQGANSVKDIESFETYRSAEGLTHINLWSGDVWKAIVRLRAFR